MVFTLFVEIGRVVMVNFGADYGKVATIIDILDQNRVLIDGPVSVTGVTRQVINLKRLSLTPIVVKIERNPRGPTLAAAWKAGNTLAAWNATSHAKKIAKQAAKANLTDFDRFKNLVARKQRSKLVNIAYAGLKKKAAKK